jgi:transcription elongation GreA/GreB family factor
MKTTSTTIETIHLSKKGMKDLKKAVSELEKDRHKTIMELHEQDKTDNHDERLARVEKLALLDSIENELDEKRGLLVKAKLYPRKSDAVLVAVGSVVELIDKSGRKVVYTIVDSIEADPSDGRISAKSPLGQNLLGKTITDTIKWGAGIRENQFQLVRIS